MSSSLHRCPHCKTTGKVHRSKPRGAGEKIRVKLMPVYSVYRCHNCNWRGWLLRTSSSPLSRALLVIGYGVVALLVIGGIIFFIVRKWPSANYQY